MGSLGFQEIVLIFIIALIIFGPRKLPELGKTLGKSLAEFKRATTDLKSSWEEEVRTEDIRAEAEKFKKDIESMDIRGEAEEFKKDIESIHTPGDDTWSK